MLFAIVTTAQSPEAFSYQAVARDATGQILSNQSVSFRVNILQGRATGTDVYAETHVTTVNDFGLVNLEIGNGVVKNGDFSAIDWGADTYFVQMEMDEAGGNNYQLLGTSQLLSVPYALYTKSAENEITKYQIGDEAHGGVVFWVDETGKHGLVAAPCDQSETILWWNGMDRVTNATGDGIGAGAMNTLLIIALQTNDDPEGNFAAKLCADLSIAVYGDWYLPSKHELNLMYTNLHLSGLGGFATDFYWSSTENDDFNAWSQNFLVGAQLNGDKSMALRVYRVRAVRAF